VFPETFKREAVDRVRTSGLPIVRVAEALGVHETVLLRWITRHAEPASPWRAATQAATPSPADLAAENARLKRELHRAETERDILKKAALAIVLGPMADNGSLFGAAGR
jgi:transposase